MYQVVCWAGNDAGMKVPLSVMQDLLSENWLIKAAEATAAAAEAAAASVPPPAFNPAEPHYNVCLLQNPMQ